MVEKYGVHGFAHRVISPERKREIGDSAGSTASRQVGLDPGYCPDKIDGVIIVLFQACSDSQNIDVENDVFRPETGLPG